MIEVILALIEYSSWPLVFLVCLIIFKNDIGKILSRIKRVKTGSVELQLIE